VTLTPEGGTFFEDCHRILAEMRSAEDALTVGAKNASGRLIVTAPTAFGRKHIAPHLAGFIAEHPNLAITLHLSERLVDLKNERFDLAIRIADLKSADLIAAKLARNHRVVCGSPDLLQAFRQAQGARRPRAPQLPRHQHRGWRRRHVEFPGQGQARHGQGGREPPVQRRRGAHALGDRGEGLAWRSAWEVSEEIKRGRLVSVLDDYAFPGNNIYAVYPERRLLPAKVKFFIEFLRKTFGDPPYWE
jgi:DNA-binding transcriptional LysR family regulator